MIEILIPTFNRDIYIRDNLKLLIDEINKNNLNKEVSILISNNCSTDNTESIIERIINNTDVNISLYNQKENIGLEKNAIFLLEKAKDSFIVFLGDDDYLPSNYLKYLLEKIIDFPDLTCVLPGLNALHADGKIIPSRIEKFNENIYMPSFNALTKLSHIGHQMSGVLLKRENLFETYTAYPSLRNIYPFIYFVSFSILQGRTIYTPQYKILVSTGNLKDWNYDDSGLLTEIFKNYKILFNKSYFKRNCLNIVFMYKQSWRLRIEQNLNNAITSFFHLVNSKNVESCTKIILPFLYIYLYLQSALTKIRNLFSK